MHTILINTANEAQLKSFLLEEFNELKEKYPTLYEEMECKLYVHLNGMHFNNLLYEKATSKLVNNDGSSGAHWSLEQIIDYARSKGLKFDNFNEYDFAYVMNMIYSDYYGVVNDNVESYYKLARAFIEDKDAPVGKAFRYYKAMK